MIRLLLALEMKELALAVAVPLILAVLSALDFFRWQRVLLIAGEAGIKWENMPMGKVP
jgi:hypothetical protein